MCAICFEEVGVLSAKLECGHVFHGNCLKQWLEYKPNCPCCRRTKTPSWDAVLQRYELHLREPQAQLDDVDDEPDDVEDEPGW